MCVCTTQAQIQLADGMVDSGARITVIGSTRDNESPVASWPAWYERLQQRQANVQIVEQLTHKQLFRYCWGNPT